MSEALPLSKQPLVTIVIVSYNTRQLTLNCIQSVLEQGSGITQQIIVLDNASRDGSADAIALQFPDVELIRSSDNHGFAKGNNIAALQARGEYILLLNPDTIVLNQAIVRLIEFAERTPDAKVWGGRTLREDMSLNKGSCWRFQSLWTIFSSSLGLPMLFPKSDFFNAEAYGDWQRDAERQVEIVTGCLLLVRRTFWEELRGFDEKFFIFAEEADLCYRAHELGAKPMITPSATIVHLCGASTTVRADKLELLWKGKVTFVLKHWPRWKAQMGIFFLKGHAAIRWWGYGVLGLMKGSARHKQAAAEWRTLFSARGRWENGFT